MKLPVVHFSKEQQQFRLDVRQFLQEKLKEGVFETKCDSLLSWSNPKFSGVNEWYSNCAESTKLSESYVRVGIVPGDGGCYYLPRLVGIDQALDLLWTGKVLTASEAKEKGFLLM